MTAVTRPLRPAPGPAALARTGWRAPAWALAAVLVAAAALDAARLGVPVTRLAALLLVAPLAEEIVLRTGLQQALQRRGWPAGAAVGACALAFAFAHVVLHAQWQAGLVLLPALAIGAVYARSGRLGDAVALHAAMNAAWIATVLHAAGRQP